MDGAPSPPRPKGKSSLRGQKQHRRTTVPHRRRRRGSSRGRGLLCSLPVRWPWVLESEREGKKGKGKRGSTAWRCSTPSLGAVARRRAAVRFLPPRDAAGPHGRKGPAGAHLRLPSLSHTQARCGGGGAERKEEESMPRWGLRPSPAAGHRRLFSSTGRRRRARAAGASESRGEESEVRLGLNSRALPVLI